MTTGKEGEGMNNVEVFEDFKKTLKEVFPNIQLDQRDELLLGMAINHAFLCMKEKETNGTK